MVEQMRQVKINQQVSGSSDYDENQIQLGLQEAQRAIKHERDNKLEDSLNSYKEAIKLFKSQVDKAPVDKQGVFQIFLKNYEEKAESLQQKINEINANPQQNQIDIDEQQFVVINENLYEKDFQDLDLKYDPQQLQAAQNNAPDDQMLISAQIPTNKKLRPFYFMRKIEKTIMEGGFLTESLYVPKYVWYQKDAKIPEIDKKLNYFDYLKKEFQRVNILYSKNCISKDKSEVDRLMSQVMLLQETLATEFNEVQKMGGGADDAMLQSLKDESTWNKISKHFKQFTDKVTKGAQKIAFNIYGTSVDLYAKALQDLFKEAYFLESWIIDLESQLQQVPQTLNNTQIQETQLLLRKLARISQFLHEVVILLVLSDLRYLVQRYLKKMFSSMTELHSKIN